MFFLIFHPTKDFRPVTPLRDHAFYKWRPVIRCLYTETELHHLHRRLSHLLHLKLHELLRLVEPNQVPGGTLALLWNI